jgi:predicted nucleic acid-binding protein
VIFVDSNIPMYLVGSPHANKDAARRLLEACLSRGEKLVTDAEVMQEILHRYTAINRREAIPPALAALQRIVDEVFPIELVDVEEAAKLLLSSPHLSARDVLHVAIMRRYEVDRILSFDRGFDLVPGLTRLG